MSVETSAATDRWSERSEALVVVPETDNPLNVAFFGHFGSGNSGNESTLLSIISELQSRSPESEFRCVCTIPEAVVARYGIDAFPLTSRDARIWDRTTPMARRVPMAFVGLGGELGQYVRAFRKLGGIDTFVVPGTGLVTDAYGLSGWGPYNLFKWVLMAKLRRARVLFLSVGAGPFNSRPGRLLVRAALSMADYRSYRDAASRDRVADIGVPATGDRIYPDLVFGLPETLLRRDGAGPGPTRPVVGLGLMDYADNYSAAGPRSETYTRYLESLAEFVTWLLAHDYDVRLLLGDSDAEAIADLRGVLESRLDGYDEERIIAPPSASVQDVVGELAATDLVVATRFHNVLLSLLLNKPVIAISFHHKSSSLMRQMKLSDYCHEIADIDATRLIEQFRTLEQNREDVRRTIARGVEEARAAVEEQYDLLFGRPADAQSSELARPGRVRQRLEMAALGHNERIWRHIPERLRGTRPARAYGAWVHGVVGRRADREMYLGTHFLRNRPELELMRRLIQTKEQGAEVKIAILGCSIGVEVYSILWTLRSSRPDLRLTVQAVDISPEVVDVAERGVYSPESSEMVSCPIFHGLTQAEREAMFEWEGDEGRIKPWLREGIAWQVGDASDPSLVTNLGPQDLVVANNFLCHMPARSAQACLRNLAQLVTPGGHLFVTGVDLDVRTAVAQDLGWEPIAELKAEIHDGDPLVRGDWPLRWWGLEPLDRRRSDWEIRYTAAFRIGTPA